MKVCVTATSGSLDAQVDPRFGRCQYFLVVDLDTMRFEAMPNPGIGAMGGAGIQAAQIVAKKGVELVITGRLGPNAYQTLSAAGIKMITGAFGTVREVIEAYKDGRMRETDLPSSSTGFGMGSGTGRRGGRGMGKRRVGGWGTSETPYASPGPPQAPAGVPMAPPAPKMSKEQEIRTLANEIKDLQWQLDVIRKRIEELTE
jgi:predicted Fe-Mo cluster-binding NifX family protein